MESRDLFWTGYQKPALMMQVLRFQVLGKEAFDPAFRDYLKTWAFKHPTPSDFFRIMRDNTGVELDWFWADWVYGTTRPDIAVEAIDNGEKGATVTLQNKGTMQLPILLRLTFADGSIENVKLPVEAWNLGDTFVYRVKNGKKVVRAQVDPDMLLPDTDRANNGRELR